MTVACGAEGTSSGNGLTVAAPTSSAEAAASQWPRAQFRRPARREPEPCPVPAAARDHSMSVPSKPVPREEDDGIPAARITLFAPERLHLKWERNVCEGAGLQNLGNTCFLNATLQCLTYTPPLANYLLLQEHSRTCKRSDFCLMCLMESHVISTFNNSIGIIQPILITRNLTRIAKHLRFGEQEDAHEFLRYMVDAMQLSCLYDHSELDRYTEATTLIYQIFGGYLRSRVECMQCLGTSITYETCLDIALHVSNSSDLVEAFREFVKVEMLDDYTCGTCCRKVKATKKLTLHRLPNVLTISIKRYSHFGTKINRDITYPEHLDVKPFMSKTQGEPVIYTLYSVLVHAGTDCDIGHYYCYNKISDGNWYCMNDSVVRRVDTGVVMNDQAYMLFYIRSPELSAIPADSYRPLGQVTAPFRAILKKRPRLPLEASGPVAGPLIPSPLSKKLEIPKLSDRFNGSNGSSNCNGNGSRTNSINNSNGGSNGGSNGRPGNTIAGKPGPNGNPALVARQRKRHNAKRPAGPAADSAAQPPPPGPAPPTGSPACPAQPFQHRPPRADLGNGAAFGAAPGASARPANGVAAAARPDGAVEGPSARAAAAAATAAVQLKHGSGGSSGSLQTNKPLSKELIREYVRLMPVSGGKTAPLNFATPSRQQQQQRHHGLGASKLAFFGDCRGRLASLVPYAPGESSEESETEVATKMGKEAANPRGRLDGGHCCVAAAAATGAGVLSASSGNGLKARATGNEAAGVSGAGVSGAGVPGGGTPGSAGGERHARLATVPSGAALNGNATRTAGGGPLADVQETVKVFVANPPSNGDQKPTSGASRTVCAAREPAAASEANGGPRPSSETAPSPSADPNDSAPAALRPDRGGARHNGCESGGPAPRHQPASGEAAGKDGRCGERQRRGQDGDREWHARRHRRRRRRRRRESRGPHRGRSEESESRSEESRSEESRSSSRRRSRAGGQWRGCDGDYGDYGDYGDSRRQQGRCRRSDSNRRRRSRSSRRDHRRSRSSSSRGRSPSNGRRRSLSDRRRSRSDRRSRRSPSNRRRSRSSRHNGRSRSSSSRRRSPSNRRSRSNRRHRRSRSSSRGRSPSNSRWSPSNRRRSPSNRRRSRSTRSCRSRSSSRGRSPSNSRRSPSNSRRSPSNRRRSHSNRRHRRPGSSRSDSRHSRRGSGGGGGGGGNSPGNARDPDHRRRRGERGPSTERHRKDRQHWTEGRRRTCHS